MPFFYPNPQNDMWRIMGLVFFDDKQHFCTSDNRFRHNEIVSFCQSRGIAIFDTAQAVIRLQGNAADEHLQIVRPTDIAALLHRLPLCHDLCCTGGKAADTLAAALHTTVPKSGECVAANYSDHLLRFWRMPSSSRAYPLSIAKKAAAYHHMFTTIGML